MPDFDLEKFVRTAERIRAKAKEEERLTENPTRDKLRRLVEKQPGVKKTVYDSFVAESEPTSRSAMFTKNGIDSSFGEEEDKLLKQCEEVLAKEKLISIDRIVGNTKSSTTVRLIIPERFAHIAYGGGNLFAPPRKEITEPTYQVIFFADEAGVRSDYHSGTTWAPRGQTPVVPTTGARFGLNLISAVSPNGDMRFMTVDGRMNSAKFIEFLKRLMTGNDRSIFLIVDGHPSHRAVKVKKFVAATKGGLRLFFLPPYSPELNPDESVWNYVKHHHIGKAKITGPDQLRTMVFGILRRLQKMPALVRSFFGQKELRYITA